MSRWVDKKISQLIFLVSHVLTLFYLLFSFLFYFIYLYVNPGATKLCEFISTGSKSRAVSATQYSLLLSTLYSVHTQITACTTCLQYTCS